jgi:hypothetical protein
VRPQRPFAAVLFALFIGVLAVGVWAMYAKLERDRFAAARNVAQSRSDIKLSMLVRRENGPLSEEEYRMQDTDGVSTASYRAVGRKGLQVTVETKPYETFEVSFLFGKLQQDGLWEVRSKPPRGDTSTVYQVHAYQEIEGKHGSHAFTFSDPKYWANAREFTIRLEKGKALPDLLVLQSNARDKRYEAIVNDFEAFGSPGFRREVARARTRAAGPN